MTRLHLPIWASSYFAEERHYDWLIKVPATGAEGPDSSLCTRFFDISLFIQLSSELVEGDQEEAPPPQLHHCRNDLVPKHPVDVHYWQWD